MKLKFRLDGMTIKRTDGNTVVSDSQEYLEAEFTLASEDWQPPITALFGDYAVLLDVKNSCLIPWEAVKNAGSLTVSAFCGKVDNDNYIHTANCCTVEIGQSCYKQGETPKPPTPDVYQSILNKAQNAENVAQSVRDDADAGLFDGADGKDGKDGLNGKDGANGTTFTPHVEPVKGGNALSWTNDGGKPNPETVTIKDGESVYCDNQPKHTATGELIALDDVYPNKPLLLGVEGKTVKDETGLTCVESAEIEVAGKNLCSRTNLKPTLYPNFYTIYEGRPIEQTCTISLSVKNFKSNTDGALVRVVYPNGDFSYLTPDRFGMQANVSQNGTFSFVQSSGFNKLELWLYSDTGIEVNNDATVEWVQLERGSKATPYEQYQGSTLPIDLKSNKLCSLPNGVHDELRVTREGERGHVELVKRTGMKMLTVKVDNILNIQGHYYVTIFSVDGFSEHDAEIYCDKIASEVVLAPAFSNIFLSGNSFLLFNPDLDSEALATKENYSQMLSELNPIVIYLLAQPQTIDLGYIDLPNLPAPNATVWSSTNLPATTTEVEYVQDINIVLDKLMQAIVAAPAMI